MQILIFNGISGQKSFITGQPVLPSGEAQELYVLLSGEVDEYDSSAHLQDTFGPGRCFNARAFFFGDESATYIAHTDILVQTLTREGLEALLQAHPVLAIEMLQEAYATHEELTQLEKEQENARHRARLQAKVQAIKASPAAAVRTAAKGESKNTAKSTPIAGQEKTVVLQGGTNPAQIKEFAPTRIPSKEAQHLAGQHQLIPSFFLPAHQRYDTIRHPEYAAYVFAKQMSCPCCGAEFEGTRVFQSKLISVSQPRYDLRQFYKDFEPAWYDLVTCPSCYFSTFFNLFLEPKNFSKSIAAKKLASLRDEVILKFEEERTLEFVFTAHYLALQCADSFLEEQKLTARLWGNISWLYEDAGEKELEKQAAHIAAQENERLYLEGRLTPTQEQMIAMTIAGMLCRAGEPKEVKRWLFEAKKQKTGKRLYTDLADDLLLELREAEG